LNSGGNVWRFTQRELFLTPLSSHVPNNDQPRMYPYTQSKLDAFVLLQTGIEVSHGSKNSQTSLYGSVGVIFMGVGVPKVHQQSIAQELSNVPVKTSDDLGADLLISPDDFAILFGVELRREFRGVHQITEHDGELPSFRFG
jgi:hypothetical protein